MRRVPTKVSRRMLFSWFILAALIFLFAPAKVTSRFQLAFAGIFRWPLNIGRNISLSARSQQPVTDSLRRTESLYQNNIANLIEELLEKRETVEKLSGLRDRLYVLEDAKLMAADVITAYIDGARNELIINRGERDGVAKGQFVLGDNSIIGTIADVSSGMARIKLVTDPASKIAVKIADVGAIMQGNGDNTAKVRLPAKWNVKTGDSVKAAPKPGFLDVPMIVGRVSQCKRDGENPLLWDITVKPACDTERLSDVAVIIMNPREQLSI